MTHIKWPNNPTTPIPSEPNWQNEAMRQNALLHIAMTGGAEAETRAAKFELERDALLRVVTDNHVALQRAEDAEAKLAKAVEALQTIANKPLYDGLLIAWWIDSTIKLAKSTVAELEKTE